MRVLYELRCWSEHRQSTACRAKQSTALSTSSLLHYGFGHTTSQVPLQSSPLAHIQIPCPGLDNHTDSRISTYLRRSSAPGGGARSRTSLAAYLFSGRTWKDLSLAERKVVLCQEESEFIWRNNHAIRAVYATDCKKRAGIHSTPGNPTPCHACLSVLCTRLFQTRIQITILHHLHTSAPSSAKYISSTKVFENLSKLYIFR